MSIANIRGPIGLLFGTCAAIQVGVALYVAAIGPFAMQLGPLPILGTNPTKTFSVGVLLACAAAWLLLPAGRSATRSRSTAILRWTALAAVVASSASFVAPILSHGFPLGHDAPAHVTYVFLFDRAITQGQFPVRWVEGMQNGLGQPLFNYYQVGFYYIVELIHWLGPSLSLSMKLAVATVWACGFGFVFLWLTPLGVFPAVLGASVFAWSPYLLLDGYVRAAYPELTAIAFVPGILWSIDRWFRTGSPLFLCALGLTTCLVLISHLPTALITAPVCAAFTVVRWRSGGHPVRQFGAALAGAALGSAMAAFYVVPAIFELDYIKILKLTSAYFDYHQHFVRPAWWLDQGWTYNSSGVAAYHMSLQLGEVQWALIAMAIGVLAVPGARRLAASRTGALAGWLAVAAAALFMMTAASVPVWHLIKPLAYLQFPWRLLMLPALACGALAALLLSMVRSGVAQALILICAVTVQWYAMRDARGAIWLNPPVAIGIDDPAWPSSENGRRLAFHEDAYDPAATVGPPAAAAARWSIADGRGEVVAETMDETRLALAVRAAEPLRLVINSPYFPGWTIFVDEQVVAPTIQSKSAYMEVIVPPGSHRVDARLENTPLRATANLVTLVGTLIWIFLAFAGVRRSRRGDGVLAAASRSQRDFGAIASIPSQ